MNDLSAFHGPNAGYVLDLYERYLKDPQSVDEESRAYFERFGGRDIDSLTAVVPPTPPPPAATAPVTAPLDLHKIVGVAKYARLIREMGHLGAQLDPLGTKPPATPELELSYYGIGPGDLEKLPSSVIGGPIGARTRTALEAIGRLRRVYSGTIGYEDDHIHIDEERMWLREAAESGRFFEDFGPDRRRQVLERLTEVEVFEQFLHQTFPGALGKRFSVEGNDMLVPILDEIIHAAAQGGTREVVMGMAHRGRLNVLAHILGKPYAAIISEFQSQAEEKAAVSGMGSSGYSGDVKYHLGARLAFREMGEEEMPITLCPNPSHLEFVNPVVQGRARAAQEQRDDRGYPVQNLSASLAILIHGDAAFPGQGIVAETLNLANLNGYRVGGSIHIIVNNQIGFTTNPRDSRSTLYASDLAKGFEIPIVHVNADDPQACIAVARMAFAYRERFGKDFLIDLIGYRRWGHNEGDEPTFTQPRMYSVIAKHPTVRAIWAGELERKEIIKPGEADEMVRALRDKLQEAKNNPPEPAAPPGAFGAVAPGVGASDAETGVEEARLIEFNEGLLSWPEGFAVSPKLERALTARRTKIHQEGGIDWGHAESLAFASMLADGVPIRLSGQDVERGTFSQRHLVVHDPNTGQRFIPLQAMTTSQASFAPYNSPLSENAVLGFEYGYSMHAARAMVIWEAQFGDFVNGAQVIIDQFLVSGYTKWRQTPSLVLLLPHGYEGQGPEHSSGRPERFLELAANNNLRIVNCTTAAQYFHVLRRQGALLEAAPRPLIVLSPKSLLRHPRAGSSLQELVNGRFQPVIDDARKDRDRRQVTRLVLCTGKVYVDLISDDAYEREERVAVARVEELYPFPARELEDLFAQYPSLREVVWVQEEPRNMGAWTYMALRLRDLIPREIEIHYVGRPESASPAEGKARQHQNAQLRIVKTALSDAPEPKAPRATRREVSHAR